MAPAPRVVVEIDPKEWERCCIESGLDRTVKIRFRRFPPKSQRAFGYPIYGEVDRATRTIYIYLCIEKYDTARYREVHNELIDTILHELRHIVQFEKWPADKWKAEIVTPYDQKPSEIDAERWAKANRTEYKGIAKIRRVFRSNLSRLAETERRIKA